MPKGGVKPHPEKTSLRIKVYLVPGKFAKGYTKQMENICADFVRYCTLNVAQSK
jgi:hypothetical protein